MKANKIESQKLDEDGYWIYLARGWQDSFNPGSHTIVENTKREALDKAKYAIKCECQDCK